MYFNAIRNLLCGLNCGFVIEVFDPSGPPYISHNHYIFKELSLGRYVIKKAQLTIKLPTNQSDGERNFPSYCFMYLIWLLWANFP